MQRSYSYSYIELMDDSLCELPEFNCYNLNEGMLLFTHRKKGIGFTYLVNTETEECYELMDKHGSLTSFTLDDINLHAIEDLPFTGNILKLKCGHGIFLNDYHNGTALFRWTYYIDSSQYGYVYDDTNFKRLYGFIDKHCKFVVPLQPMTQELLQKLLLHQNIGFNLNR